MSGSGRSETFVILGSERWKDGREYRIHVAFLATRWSILLINEQFPRVVTTTNLLRSGVLLDKGEQASVEISSGVEAVKYRGIGPVAPNGFVLKYD